MVEVEDFLKLRQSATCDSNKKRAGLLLQQQAGPHFCDIM
jgi:hypothetical protein